jgi:hypothetical protein
LYAVGRLVVLRHVCWISCSNMYCVLLISEILYYKWDYQCVIIQTDIYDFLSMILNPGELLKTIEQWIATVVYLSLPLPQCTLISFIITATWLFCLILMNTSKFFEQGIFNYVL